MAMLENVTMVVFFFVVLCKKRSLDKIYSRVDQDKLLKYGYSSTKRSAAIWTLTSRGAQTIEYTHGKLIARDSRCSVSILVPASLVRRYEKTRRNLSKIEV